MRCSLRAMNSIRAFVTAAFFVFSPLSLLLITGPSGVGKERVAALIRANSARKDRAWVTVDAGTLRDALLVAELFGAEAGAYTGATGLRVGRFEQADGGTLFLDEIGDMEYGLQSRLLRVLEDGRVRRVGETRDRPVDVRVIAATHTDLEAAVREKRFREDLYFRLAHLPIRVPPLREHKQDIRLLFEHFVSRFCRQQRCHVECMPAFDRRHRGLNSRD